MLTTGPSQPSRRVLLAASALATLAYVGLSDGEPRHVKTFVSRSIEYLFAEQILQCRRSGFLFRQAVDLATRKMLDEGIASPATQEGRRYTSPCAIIVLLHSAGAPAHRCASAQGPGRGDGLAAAAQGHRRHN
jgi:hypothetical protein